jgi:hypothetical protein
MLAAVIDHLPAILSGGPVLVSVTGCFVLMAATFYDPWLDSQAHAAFATLVALMLTALAG